jgi:hypothetical protein
MTLTEIEQYHMRLAQYNAAIAVLTFVIHMQLTNLIPTGVLLP